MSPKIHAIADALGNPTSFVLTSGQAHDLNGADQLVPGMQAQIVIADKAFSAAGLQPLKKSSKGIVIPSTRLKHREIMTSICIKQGI